ncbi:MAG: GSCFA domain-containing protein [Duncaniella sp.]|nr:GSCFA domain-containing protein [Duncaniella sp.]
MQFRSEQPPIQGHEGTVNHRHPLLLVGSCFADNIGAELSADLFNVCVNPFGPLYNPLSVLSAVGRLASGATVSAEELFERDGYWHHWGFHSRYSRPECEASIEAMNSAIADGSNTLRNASAIFITLGTTSCYILKETGSVVANCHKLPSGTFSRRELSLQEVTNTLAATVALIRKCNPEDKIVFTVSPLRYLADGLHANSIIKATLMLAVEEITHSCADTLYFPAYEIMIDDLRDYRFYADDLKHPSLMAVSYIYHLFGRSFFSQDTLKAAEAGRRITRRLAHRSESATPLSEIKELSLLDSFPELRQGLQRFLSLCPTQSPR